MEQIPNDNSRPLFTTCTRQPNIDGSADGMKHTATH